MRIKACIYELLNFLSDVTKRMITEALFFLLFASLVILHLIYASQPNKIYQF